MGKNNAELISIIPFKEDKIWYLKLVYKYKDEKGEHIVEFPKTTLPFTQEYLPSITITSNPFYFGTCTYINCNDSVPLYKAVSALASKRGIKDPACYFDIITEPVSREMTLDEIEKELGYKVKIINKKKK